MVGGCPYSVALSKRNEIPVEFFVRKISLSPPLAGVEDMENICKDILVYTQQYNFVYTPRVPANYIIVL